MATFTVVRISRINHICILITLDDLVWKLDKMYMLEFNDRMFMHTDWQRIGRE